MMGTQAYILDLKPTGSIYFPTLTKLFYTWDMYIYSGTKLPILNFGMLTFKAKQMQLYM